MWGLKSLAKSSLAGLVVTLWLAANVDSSWAQYQPQRRSTAPQGDVAASQSRLAQAPRPGEFASRTTHYAPAWRVHPKVRTAGEYHRTGGSVRQARLQQGVVQPDFDEPSVETPFPLDDEETQVPETTRETPTLAPPQGGDETEIEQPPRATETTPRGNGRRRAVQQPGPPENLVEPYAESYEELPAPRGEPRPGDDFGYEVTEGYGPYPDEYQYGEQFADSPCPDCGQYGEMCQCGPPHVCDDRWPCWHWRSRWRNFRLFGGGWDVGCPWNWWDELSLFAGPHSFKGPLDQGLNGNFGVQAGVNWGGPLWHLHGIGFQLGGQGVHSNFAGDAVNGMSDSTRNQMFLTAGVFARAPCGHGWQLGVAFDWLEDDYYVDVNLDQIRAELSYVTFCGSELGAWVATSSSTEEDDVNGVRYEVTDMYALFFRHGMPSGGEGRIWGGGTTDGNGMLGADFRVPLSNRWTLAGTVNYIIPQDGSGDEGLNEESWGMTINVVWYPFRARHGHPGNNGPYRPLFNVADNTVFMVDRETGGQP